MRDLNVVLAIIDEYSVGSVFDNKTVCLKAQLATALCILDVEPIKYNTLSLVDQRNYLKLKYFLVHLELAKAKVQRDPEKIESIKKLVEVSKEFIESKSNDLVDLYGQLDSRSSQQDAESVIIGHEQYQQLTDQLTEFYRGDEVGMEALTASFIANDLSGILQRIADIPAIDSNKADESLNIRHNINIKIFLGTELDNSSLLSVYAQIHQQALENPNDAMIIKLDLNSVSENLHLQLYLFFCKYPEFIPSKVCLILHNNAKVPLMMKGTRDRPDEDFTATVNMMHRLCRKNSKEGSPYCAVDKVNPESLKAFIDSEKAVFFLKKNLTEFRQNDITLSQNAARVVNALDKIDRSQLEPAEAEFLGEARQRYNEISTDEDLWNKIIPDTQNLTDQEILKIFEDLNQSMVDPERNKQIYLRIVNCGWVTLHYTRLLALVKNQSMALNQFLESEYEHYLPIDALIITPFQRLPRLGLFASEWCRNVALLSEDLTGKEAVLSIRNKFKRILSTLQQIMKAIAEQDKTSYPASTSIWHGFVNMFIDNFPVTGGDTSLSLQTFANIMQTKMQKDLEFSLLNSELDKKAEELEEQKYEESLQGISSKLDELYASSCLDGEIFIAKVEDNLLNYPTDVQHPVISNTPPMVETDALQIDLNLVTVELPEQQIPLPPTFNQEDAKVGSQKEPAIISVDGKKDNLPKRLSSETSLQPATLPEVRSNLPTNLNSEQLTKSLNPPPSPFNPDFFYRLSEEILVHQKALIGVLVITAIAGLVLLALGTCGLGLFGVAAAHVVGLGFIAAVSTTVAGGYLTGNALAAVGFFCCSGGKKSVTNEVPQIPDNQPSS